METDLNNVNAAWNDDNIVTKIKSHLGDFSFEEIIGGVLTPDSMYYFMLDFRDMSLSNMSDSIKEIHGLDPSTTTLTDIYDLIHPDDRDHAAKAELVASKYIDEKRINNISLYKFCYSFRLKTADGSYKLFLHQSLAISIDKEGKLANTLNIHTDISHLTTENNYKMHFIGLKGQPSFMNLGYKDDATLDIKTSYTNRELQIIKMLSLGKSTQTIADEIFITFNTVKNHRRNILKKSKCNNVAELITMCTIKGLI